MTVLAIFGPTASGKSAVAEAIARRIPADLIAADSAQLYRDLPILTNQSPAALVGIWSLGHEASVAEFQTITQQFSLLMNTTTNAIKSLGEAMANTARKN